MNIFYLLHILFAKIIFKGKSQPIDKEAGELSFVSAATGLLLLVGYLWIGTGHYVEYAWIYVLVVDLLIFLACFLGFCVATLMYVLLRNMLKKKSGQTQ